MNFEPVSTLLTGIVIGIIGALFTFAFVLPDAWSTWLARRQNMPFWLAPVAVLGLMTFVVFFLPAIRLLDLQPWVWWLLGASLALLAIAGIVHAIYHRRPTEAEAHQPA